MKKTFSKNVIFLSFISFLNDIASDMIYPLLPVFITSVGGNAKVLGLIEGISETVSSFLKLLSGRFSDKIRKRKLLAFSGYFLSNALRPLYYFANYWHTIFFVRFADRIGKGIRTAPRDALIAESTSSENRGKAFGFHRALDNLGALIGPLLASLILGYFSQNIRYVFLFSLIPGFLVLILFIFVKEKEKVETEKITERQIVENGNFNSLPYNLKLFLLALLIFTLGNSTDAFLILRLKEAGFNTVHIPLIWGIFNFIKSIGNYPAGVISDRVGRKKIILAGWVIYALVYLLMGLIKDKYLVLFLFLLYGIYYSLTEGAERAYIADNVLPENRGKAFGYYNFTISITTLPASFLFGYLWDKYSYTVAFLTGASFSILAIIILLVSFREGKKLR